MGLDQQGFGLGGSFNLERCQKPGDRFSELGLLDQSLGRIQFYLGLLVDQSLLGLDQQSFGLGSFFDLERRQKPGDRLGKFSLLDQSLGRIQFYLSLLVDQ